MRTRPPALLDRLFTLLLPPAARDAVLGDLWERYRSPLQFASEGVKTVPYVVASQARRTSRLAIIGLQIFILVACLGGFEPTRDNHLVAPWAAASIPALAALVGLVLRNVYRGQGNAVRQGVLDAVTAGGLILASQLVLGALAAAGSIGPGWTLPLSLQVLATLSLPILCVLGATENSQEPQPSPTAEILAEYAGFSRRVRARNWAEMLALVAIIGVSAFFLTRFPPAVAPFGWAFLTGYACLLTYLGSRGWAQSVQDGGNPHVTRTVYQAELARHNRLRRLMWWFWFVPLFAGLITNLILLGINRGEPLRMVAGFACFGLLAYLIERLNRDRSRSVHMKIAALAAAA